MTIVPWQVDAFTGPGAAGNRAGVVLVRDSLDDDRCQAMARDFGFPATAFVGPSDSAGLRPIRWFDPRSAIGLCGHGTLAAGHVLLSPKAGSATRFSAPDGRILPIRRLEDWRCELSLPAIVTEPRDLPELAGFLGAGPRETRFHADGYALAIFTHAAQVEALVPDFPALGALGWQVTATAPAPADCEEAIVSRVFTRNGGEDQATGSAHAALTHYWAQRLGRDTFVARQASTRGAVFWCRLDGGTVRLSGSCETVVRGSP